MDEVASVLRERASRLTSDNPASQALPMIENLAGDEERFRRLGHFARGFPVRTAFEFQKRPDSLFSTQHLVDIIVPYKGLFDRFP